MISPLSSDAVSVKTDLLLPCPIFLFLPPRLAATFPADLLVFNFFVLQAGSLAGCFHLLPAKERCYVLRSDDDEEMLITSLSRGLPLDAARVLCGSESSSSLMMVGRSEGAPEAS